MIGIYKYPDYLRRKDIEGNQWYKYSSRSSFSGYGYTQWRKLDWKGDFASFPDSGFYIQESFVSQEEENAFFLMGVVTTYED